jgi:hypothetical protein
VQLDGGRLGHARVGPALDFKLDCAMAMVWQSVQVCYSAPSRVILCRSVPQSEHLALAHLLGVGGELVLRHLLGVGGELV